MRITPSAPAGALLLLLISLSFARGQDINIRRIELENEKVFIYYDLKDTTRGRLYSVNLYSSRDNYINPLSKLKGDFGIEVVPGQQRKIEINAVEEFGATFEGKVAFELRAKVYIPFIRLDGFNGSKFKRGKPYEIRWTGGRPQNVLNFDLYDGEQKITTFSNIPNAGKYNLVFPSDTKPGKYKFRISDSKNRDEVVNTGEFSITRKIPMMLMVVPGVIVVGGAVYFLTRPPVDDCPDCLPEFLTTPEEN